MTALRVIGSAIVLFVLTAGVLVLGAIVNGAVSGH